MPNILPFAIAAAVVVLLVAGGIWGWNAFQESRRIAAEKANAEKLAVVRDFVTSLVSQDPASLLDLAENPAELEKQYPDAFKPNDARGEVDGLNWDEKGDTLVFTVDGEDGSYLVRVSPTDPTKVTMTARDGADELPPSFGSIEVVSVKGTWKLTNKWLSQALGQSGVVEASDSSSSGSDSSSSNSASRSCYANQRTIEGAAQTYQADKGELPSEGVVSDSHDLVPNYIKTAPTCPTTGVTYTLKSDGTVEPCPVHGHY